METSASFLESWRVPGIVTRTLPDVHVSRATHLFSKYWSTLNLIDHQGIQHFSLNCILKRSRSGMVKLESNGELNVENKSVTTHWSQTINCSHNQWEIFLRNSRIEYHIALGNCHNSQFVQIGVNWYRWNFATKLNGKIILGKCRRCNNGRTFLWCFHS